MGLFSCIDRKSRQFFLDLEFAPNGIMHEVESNMALTWVSTRPNNYGEVPIMSMISRARNSLIDPTKNNWFIGYAPTAQHIQLEIDNNLDPNFNPELALDYASHGPISLIDDHEVDPRVLKIFQ